MNTPTKTTQMAPPVAPMKIVPSSTPMTPTMGPHDTAPDAPKKKTLTQSAADAASGAYKSITANLFASEAPSVGGKKRKSMKKSRKSRKSRKGNMGGNPKKGMVSKTRKSRKDFVTHKGDKYYNRNGKRQSMNRKGRKGKPYSKRH